MKPINTLARLRVSGTIDNPFADLYLPLDIWKQLLEDLKGNKLTVTLRFEGENGTTLLKGFRIQKETEQ